MLMITILIPPQLSISQRMLLLEAIPLLSKKIYVERSDIRLEDNKSFFGFAPGKLVGLKYSFLVRVKNILTAEKRVKWLDLEFIWRLMDHQNLKVS